LEVLGVEGGGELAGWAGRLAAGRPASRDGGLCGLFVLQEGAEAVHVQFHVAPLGLAKRLCGLDKAL